MEGLRKLYNKEFHYLYCSSNIIRVLMPRRMSLMKQRVKVIHKKQQLPYYPRIHIHNMWLRYCPHLVR
jgi:hypothetical protein